MRGEISNSLLNDFCFQSGASFQLAISDENKFASKMLAPLFRIFRPSANAQQNRERRLRFGAWSRRCGIGVWHEPRWAVATALTWSLPVSPKAGRGLDRPGNSGASSRHFWRTMLFGGVLGISAPLHGADWFQWRGPTRDGISAESSRVGANRGP